MNKKLKKYLDDGERMEKRIQEMQEQLRAVRSAQELEENKEIVKSFRGMKLDSRELFSLLCGLQDGSVTFQKIEGAADTPEAGAGGENDVTSQEPESRENISEESEDKDNEAEMDENA